MGNILRKLALASQRAPGQRTFQFLHHHDLPRLEAFFLSFDFDQRRTYFGGGISDQSIRSYCSAIDWTATTVIARGGPYCLEAVAMLVSRPPDHASVELSIGCPLACNQRSIMAELLDLSIEVAACKYQALVVSHELAPPGLLGLLRRNYLASFGRDYARIDLATSEVRTAAC